MIYFTSIARYYVIEYVRDKGNPKGMDEVK